MFCSVICTRGHFLPFEFIWCCLFTAGIEEASFLSPCPLSGTNAVLLCCELWGSCSSHSACWTNCPLWEKQSIYSKQPYDTKHKISVGMIHTHSNVKLWHTAPKLKSRWMCVFPHYRWDRKGDELCDTGIQSWNTKASALTDTRRTLWLMGTNGQIHHQHHI